MQPSAKPARAARARWKILSAAMCQRLPCNWSLFGCGPWNACQANRNSIFLATTYLSPHDQEGKADTRQDQNTSEKSSPRVSNLISDCEYNSGQHKIDQRSCAAIGKLEIRDHQSYETSHGHNVKKSSQSSISYFERRAADEAPDELSKGGCFNFLPARCLHFS